MADSFLNDGPVQLPGSTVPVQQKGALEPVATSENVPQLLAQWVMTRVNRWRSIRDNEWQRKWDEWYRLWRGEWSAEDKNRTSERSRIITPALAQAIDLTHAEIVEAVFGRERWFDVEDDIRDEQKEDIEANRDQLDEDIAKAGVPDSIIKALQIGTIYGTGALKISTDKDQLTIIDQDDNESVEDQVVVRAYPIDVRELVPDPSTDCVDDMLGIAHETVIPMHVVHEKQASGFYFDTPIAALVIPNLANMPRVQNAQMDAEDAAYITEYHGKVPLCYMLELDMANAKDQAAIEHLNQQIDAIDGDDTVLVEAIITIGNQMALLRAKRNPFWGQDRSIVAYQHETVPGEFWGRGVAEKGYNAQKALDAEHRMRIDTLALIAAPMVAADKSRYKGDMRIFPGKEWPTMGPPAEVLMPFNFGTLNPATFDQGSDLERMVQVGTGAMDVGAALSQGSRRDTAAGTAMMSSGLVKRSKRTMYNIENQLLQPLLGKIMRRYMQFDKARYPTDMKFRVKGAMGIMAREYEQSILQQLYNTTTPEEGPVRMMLLKEIFNMSSSPNKLKMEAAIDQLLQPPSKEDQERQKQVKDLQFRQLVAQVGLVESQAANQAAQAGKNTADAQGIIVETQVKGEELIHDAVRLQIDKRETDIMAGQTQLAAQGNVLKAKALDLQQQKINLDRSKANR